MGILNKLFSNNSGLNKNSNGSEIIICPNCGTKIENDENNYCTICGYSLKELHSKIGLGCPECGQLYDDDTTICPTCKRLLISMDKDPLYYDFMKEYAITLVLWGYDKPRELIKNNSMPVYYTYECEITDVELLQREMIEHGLLKHPDDDEMLLLLKVNQLKDILRENDLSTSGKKDELITRILNSNINIDIYSNKDNYYIISEAGQAFYDRNSDFVELHRNWKYRISPLEYYEMRKRLTEKNKTSNYRDIVWGIFQKRLIGYINRKDYSNLYYNYENMADFSFNKGKFNVAVQFYVKCVIYELCGVNYYQEYTFYKSNLYLKDELIERIKEGMIHCNSIKSLVKCKDYFSKDMVEREYSHLEMNFKLCSLEFIEKIIDEAMNDSMFNIDDYTELIKRERLSNIKKYI